MPVSNQGNWQPQHMHLVEEKEGEEDYEDDDKDEEEEIVVEIVDREVITSHLYFYAYSVKYF